MKGCDFMGFTTKVIISNKTRNEIVQNIENLNYFMVLNKNSISENVETVFLQKQMLRISKASIVASIILVTINHDETEVYIDLFNPVLEGLLLDFNAANEVLSKVMKCI